MTSSRNNDRRASNTWASFWHGATRASFTSLGITLGIVALGFLIYFIFANGQLLAGPGFRYFMDGDLDTQTYATHQLLNIQAGDKPDVMIFGTSVMVRCIKDRETVRELVLEASSKSTNVYDLSTDGFMPWELEAMIDRLPDGGHGVAVLGVSYGFLLFGPDHLRTLIEQPKLGFPTPTIDDAARDAGIEVPDRAGIYSLDASYYFLSRRKTLLVNLLRGGFDYGDPLTAPWMKQVNNPEFWAKEKAKLPRFTERLAEHGESNLDVIGRSVERLRSKGQYSIIIYEAPFNPGWLDVEGGATFYRDVRSALEAFSRRYDLTFAAAADDVEFSVYDFVDYEGHLGKDRARMACTQSVTNHIAKELGK